MYVFSDAGSSLIGRGGDFDIATFGCQMPTLYTELRPKGLVERPRIGCEYYLPLNLKSIIRRLASECKPKSTPLVKFTFVHTCPPPTTSHPHVTVTLTTMSVHALHITLYAHM